MAKALILTNNVILAYDLQDLLLETDASLDIRLIDSLDALAGELADGLAVSHAFLQLPFERRVSEELALALAASGARVVVLGDDAGPLAAVLPDARLLALPFSMAQVRSLLRE